MNVEIDRVERDNGIRSDDSAGRQAVEESSLATRWTGLANRRNVLVVKFEG